MSVLKPIFYGNFRSSCSWRVRIALNLKKVDYEYRPINLRAAGGKLDPEFLRVNPVRKLPVLVVDGKAIVESLAIIEYIDEACKPERVIVPKDPIERAIARGIALQVTAGIQPLQNLRITRYLDSQEKGFGNKWANYWHTDGLKDLEALVQKSAGTYCVGDTITIADLCIPSILYKAKSFDVDTEQFKTLTKINRHLSKIPEFKAAEPQNQPDYPK